MFDFSVNLLTFIDMSDFLSINFTQKSVRLTLYMCTVICVSGETILTEGIYEISHFPLNAFVIRIFKIYSIKEIKIIQRNASLILTGAWIMRDKGCKKNSGSNKFEQFGVPSVIGFKRKFCIDHHSILNNHLLPGQSKVHLYIWVHFTNKPPQYNPSKLNYNNFLLYSQYASKMKKKEQKHVCRCTL